MRGHLPTERPSAKQQFSFWHQGPPRGDTRPWNEAATSILLNIAEGNGRYGELDHRRFLDLAAAAAVKVAAGLDLATRKTSWDRMICEPGKILLERIVAMLLRMRAESPRRS